MKIIKPNETYIKVNRKASKGDFIIMNENYLFGVFTANKLYEVFSNKEGNIYFINDKGHKSNVYTNIFNRNENTVDVYELIKN